MEFTEITLADFIQDVLPSAGHNRTQVLQMAVGQEGAEVIKEGRKVGVGKDLLYHHVDDHYKITLGSIQAYFAENPRPKKTLNAEEENKALKAEVAELKKQVAVIPGPTTKPPIDKAQMAKPASADAKDEIPPKDEAIPPKKLSQTDFASKLRTELKDKKGPSKEAVAGAKKKDIPRG